MDSAGKCTGKPRLDAGAIVATIKQERELYDVLRWTVKYRRVFDKQESMVVPIDFDTRPWLVEMYNEIIKPGADVWIMKGRQMEISTMVVNIIHYMAWRYPWSTHAHAWPRDKTAGNFNNIQLKPMYKMSPLMTSMFDKDSVKNVHQKSFKNGSSYLLTFVLKESTEKSEGTVDIRSLPADSMFMDERDTFPEDSEGPLLESMSHSNLQITVRLGTPSIPDNEFDMGFKRSTMRRWFVKCKECGAEQYVRMRNIMRDKGGPLYYGCKHCRGELDRMTGRWLDTNPEGKFIGYHLNQLVAPWITPDKIMRAWHKANDPLDPSYSLRRFRNEKLGWPFAGKRKPVDLSALYACCDVNRAMGAARGTGPIVLAGDWGDISRWILMQMTKQRQVLILDTGVWADDDINEHTRRADEMLKKHRAWGVFCAGYNHAGNQTLMKRHRGRFYAYYLTGGKYQTVPELEKKPLKYHIKQEHAAFCEQTLTLINGGIATLVIPWAHCDPKRPSYNKAQHDKLMDFFNEMTRLKADDAISGGVKVRKYEATDAHAFVSLGYGLAMLAKKYKAGKRASTVKPQKARGSTL